MRWLIVNRVLQTRNDKMRWMILLSLAGLALAGTAAADSQTDALCRPIQQEWNSVAGGTDVTAMDREIAKIPPLCATLKAQAQQQRARAVARGNMMKTPKASPARAATSSADLPISSVRGVELNLDEYCQNLYDHTSRSVLFNPSDPNSWHCTVGSGLALISIQDACRRAGHGRALLGSRSDGNSWSCATK